MIKIAIVEDDEAIIQMYRFKFEAEGYQVDTALNGKLGLELAQRVQPDAILIDLMMPEMSGDQLITELLKESWIDKTKIIVLTNIGRNEAPPTLNGLRIDKYIVKAQYTPSQVVMLVKEALGIANA